MNVELKDFGIHNEKSDIRAHVGPVTRIIFVFHPCEALAQLKRKEYPLVSAYQPGISFPTAKGYLIPIDDVRGLIKLPWHSVSWWNWFREDSSTSEKGKMAVKVILELMKIGRFPLFFPFKESTDCRIQIQGEDIIAWGKWRIQVKCDFKAGPKPLGSGNFFIQKSECNPLKLI